MNGINQYRSHRETVPCTHSEHHCERVDTERRLWKACAFAGTLISFVLLAALAFEVFLD